LKKSLYYDTRSEKHKKMDIVLMHLLKMDTVLMK